MSKPASRAYSRYSHDAARLLGLAIRERRLARKLTVEELASRAGISRGLLHRIERGDMGCAIGAAFEAAATVGVPLFESDAAGMARRVADTEKTLALMPRSVRLPHREVNDDF